MDQKISSLKARGEFQQRLRQGLVTRPVVFPCDHCGQQISGEMEWSCGYCDYGNRRTTLYSLLYKCQKCDKEPKSCTCPSCGKVVFLDEDRDATHPASKTKKVPKVEPPEDPRAKRRQEHADEIEKLEMEYRVTERILKIAQLKASGDIKKEETEREKAKKRLDAMMDKRLGAFDEARERQKKANETDKDDPERLKEIRDVIKDFLEDESLH